tara:strand:- start:91 stop:459 length:369 start_codon:yes stop_codon:yes gene_type:complete
MNAFGVALPLQRDSADGFVMIKTIKTLIKQNLKMLLLTNPGERVMAPSFGVGIKQYLFQNFGHSTPADIENKIREQVKIYMPAINIQEISFGRTDPDSNTLGFSIVYSIPDINIKDFLEFTI